MTNFWSLKFNCQEMRSIFDVLFSILLLAGREQGD